MQPFDLALQSAKAEVDSILSECNKAAQQGTFTISRPEIMEATREILDYKGFTTWYSEDKATWKIDFGDPDDLEELHREMEQGEPESRITP